MTGRWNTRRGADGWFAGEALANESAVVGQEFKQPYSSQRRRSLFLETTMRLGGPVLAALLLFAPSQSRAGESPALSAFEELKNLVGNWKSTNPEDPTRIEVKLIANGSALVETWTMSPARQSMTIYTLDGERVIATHYCPQGNAPRLAFSGTDESGAHHFQFIDGANIQNPDGSHAHALWIRKEADGTLTKHETYISNDATYDPEEDTGDTQTFAPAE